MGNYLKRVNDRANATTSFDYVAAVTSAISALALDPLVSSETFCSSKMWTRWFCWKATIRDQAAFYGVVPGTRVLALSNLCWDPSVCSVGHWCIMVVAMREFGVGLGAVPVELLPR